MNEVDFVNSVMCRFSATNDTMLERQPYSAVDRYKKSLAIFLVVSLGVGYIALRRSWTPSVEWIQQLETVVYFVNNRSAEVVEVINSSANNPASVDSMIGNLNFKKTLINRNFKY